LAAIAEGKSEIHFYSDAADCQSTLNCLERLGVEIHPQGGTVIIEGGGLGGLKAAKTELDAGNSGSTMRMLAGILAAQPFRSRLVGDASLSHRPMRRIAEPLARMGARIHMREGGLPPLEIEGAKLRPIQYEMPVPSAQVKTAVLLAGLFADGVTEVTEPAPTRNHTEIALEQMGAAVGRHGRTVRVEGRARLSGQKIYVPGDISSAAFFVVAGLMVPGSDLTLENVGLNPSRTGILRLISRMGGRVRVLRTEMLNGELIGDLRIEASEIRGGEIPKAMIPELIDELPVLAVLGTQTEAGLTFHGAEELRVKESDRLAAVAENLRRMGAQVEEFPDGLSLSGRQKLHGAEIETSGDHRIAMAFAVAGLVAEGMTVLNEVASVKISFPTFFEVLEKARA
jgi:3-phosphoshikimate 1-carboxyvinyltransferase